ncbi:MAG TPA: rhomboid family intramembrane serine protease [Patescibacteria group bacterium]|nr:rhomboid family intramembrane serine protease [Patescibacteria group bacterium]
MTVPPPTDPLAPGPLDRATAAALLARADELMAAGEYGPARAYYARLVGMPDPGLTAAALVGAGEALYRLDDEEGARQCWEQATRLPENPVTYRAHRQVAAARVREGDLRGARDAYREAERRAPAQDRAEIAARLGWLSKELGDQRAAGRYFSRSRSGDPRPLTSYAIIAVTILVSFVAFQQAAGDVLMALWLDKQGLADGEWWRLVTPVLVHGSLLHLLFNMYFLYLVGPLVENLYGSARFLLLFGLTAAAGSAASFVFGGPAPSVGASGAIFGLCGVLIAVSAVHRPVLDRRGRAIMGQIGGLVVLNLVIGFGFDALGARIDNAAHVGGLLGGLWLGLCLTPIRATLASYWQRPATPGAPGATLGAGGTVLPGRVTALVRLVGVAAAAALIIAAVVLGSPAG